MKALLLCLCLCACGSVNTQAATDTTPHQEAACPQYRNVEVRCAQQTISDLYSHAERYGRDIYVFGVKPSEVWNAYLKCIMEHKP